MNTIVVQGDLLRKEVEAAGAITPGHLITNAGVVHAVAAGIAQTAFAIENDLVGDGIDDAYASGETVQYGIFYPGAEIYAWLAAGETATKGCGLVSAADGTLAVVGSGEEAGVVAFAAEAVNNSASSDAVRITVEAR